MIHHHFFFSWPNPVSGQDVPRPMSVAEQTARIALLQPLLIG